jgi:endonuclease YncB( thermonuclease family)
MATTAPRSYQYEAVVLDVVDGDTAKFSIRLRRSRAGERDLGFHVMFEDGFVVVHESMRFMGINAAEHATDSGDSATAYLKRQLPVGSVVLVVSERDKQEKYGRFLATVFKDGKNINDKLVASGHAVYWDGHGPRPVPGG